MAKLTYIDLPGNLFSLTDQDIKRLFNGLFYTEVIRSLIIYEVNAIRAGGIREDRTMRGLWYTLIKPILSRAGRLNELGTNNKDPVDWTRKLSEELKKIVDLNYTSYEELNIIDGSRQRRPARELSAKLIDVPIVGGHYPHIILFTEKDTIWPIVESIAALYGVSAISGGGEPSSACSEYMTREIIRSEVFKKNQSKTIILISLTDYDPSGYDISKAQLDQINTAARNMPKNELGNFKRAIPKRIGLTPDQLTPAELAANSYRPKNKGLDKWLKETGGINGQPLGLELDSLPTSRLRAMYAEAIEQVIDLTSRYNDLKEAFIDLMACSRLMPEFNERRATLISQAEASPIYNDIMNATLSDSLFYEAAIAGKYWVSPNETLQLFKDYQEPLTQLWDKPSNIA